MQADICQLGLDQRKVNVLAREYCDQCKPKRKLKPVILSHEMMPGLLQVKALLHHHMLHAMSVMAVVCTFYLECTLAIASAYADLELES